MAAKIYRDLITKIQLNESILFESHGIDGLPSDAEVHSKRVKELQQQGFKLVARNITRDLYEIIAIPPLDKRIKDFKIRVHAPERGSGYYDPDHAEVHTIDPDEIIARNVAKPKEHVIREISKIDNAIYRGMSMEEFEYFKKHGHIKSKGSHNIGDVQEGLTYWTTRPESAVAYANSFAPKEFRPHFERPAYVVVAEMPDKEDIKDVEGVGEHEVGVKRAIESNEIIEVWEGKVVIYEPEKLDLRELNDGSFTETGGGRNASAVLNWTKIKE